MEPIGTGLANDIPSSDKKRMGERVKRVAFVNPSCRTSRVIQKKIRRVYRTS
jgi:hypothetical protein